VHSYGGIASCIAKVSTDCVSANRDLIRLIDADGTRSPISVVDKCRLDPIVVRATAKKNDADTTATITSNPVQNAVSGDPAKDALHAVAAREHSATNTEWGYLTDSVG
jgi:hypothetical protein